MKIRHLFSLGFLIVLLDFQIILAKGIQFNEKGIPLYYQGMITVKIKPGLPRLRIGKNLSSTGIKSLDKKLRKYSIHEIQKRFQHRPIPAESDLPGISRIYLLKFSENQPIEEMIDEISKDTSIEYVEPVPVNIPLATPNDPGLSSQYFLQQIQAQQAWDIHKGEQGTAEVYVGVSDVGVDWDHADLLDNIWQNLEEDADRDGHVLELIDNRWQFDPDDINQIDDDQNGYVDDFIGWNFCANYDFSGAENNNPDDPDGHGTHVAGIAAGVTNNQLGIASIGWNIKLISTAHAWLDQEWGGYYIFNGMNGAIYAAENGAVVVNCSFGNNGYYQAQKDAVQYIWQLGTVIVAAAGNYGSTILEYPAAYPHVLSVASVNSDDQLSMMSNHGIFVHLCAPGEQIYSTLINNEYGNATGTSMSAPLVTGLLGLIKSHHPDYSQMKLITQVMGTCDSISSQNPDKTKQVGAGRINAFRALDEQNPTIPTEYKLSWNSKASVVKNSQGNYTFSLKLRNYSFYSGEDDAKILINSNDEDIVILQNELLSGFPANDEVEFDSVFEIQINNDSSPSLRNLQFTIESQSSVSYGQSKEYQFLFGESPIWVWEPFANGDNLSGKFIADFLNENRLDCYYTNTFPHFLDQTQVLFLSYGNLSNLSENHFKILRDYLKKGGSLFIDGNAFTGGNIIYQQDTLFSLLGVDSVLQKNDNHFISCLEGKEQTLAENMQFKGISLYSHSSLTEVTPKRNSLILFEEKNFGNVGFQFSGEHNQKIVYLSFPIARLIDDHSSHSKRELLRRILDFFELRVPLMADFKFERLQNSGLPAYQFFDLSITTSNYPISYWLWNLNSDSTINSGCKNPVFHYDQNGVYDIQLSVSDGVESATVKKEDFIHVFSHGCALKTDSFLGHMIVPSDTVYETEKAFTLQLWLKPNSSVLDTLSYYYDDLIVMRNNFWLTHSTNHSIILDIEFNDDDYQYIETDDNIIKKNCWNHIAFCFDSENVTGKLYVNGEFVGGFQESGSNKQIEWQDYTSNIFLTIANAIYGSIDEVSLWNRALSENEIVSHYREYVNPESEGLVAYWQFNQGGGKVVYDHTDHHLDGYLYHAEWVEGFDFSITAFNETNQPNKTTRNINKLMQNSPNPFSRQTKIAFYLKKKTLTEILIFNLLGQKVKTLAHEINPAGKNELIWDGKDDHGHKLSNGIYFYRINTPDFTETKKMILLR